MGTAIAEGCGNLGVVIELVPAVAFTAPTLDPTATAVAATVVVVVAVDDDDPSSPRTGGRLDVTLVFLALPVAFDVR